TRRVLSQFRQLLIGHDPGRYGPIWIELDIPDAVAEHRGAVVGLADDDRHMLLDIATVDAAQIEPGDVDDHILLAKVFRHPSQTLHGHDDALDTLLDRHIHRNDRGSANNAIAFQTLTRLESLDGVGQRVVVDFRFS